MLTAVESAELLRELTHLRFEREPAQIERVEALVREARKTKHLDQLGELFSEQVGEDDHELILTTDNEGKSASFYYGEFTKAVP